MGPSTKILGQSAYNTRSRIEEKFLVLMDKSTHEEHLSQPLQTNNKQFKIAVTFLSVYNVIFKVADKNTNFCFTKSITDDGLIQITIDKGA